MEAFLLRFVQDVKHQDSVVIPSENQADFLLLFGLVQRVRRLTKAFLLLRKKGFASESELLVRAALEHSVTAQWAYLVDGGLQRLRKSMAKAQHDLARGMLPYSDTQEWREAEREAAEALPNGKGLPKLNGPGGILADLDSTHFLRATYRVLSQVGHVTHESHFDFIVPDGDGSAVLVDVPAGKSYELELVYAMAGFCMLASWVMARLERDERELSKLRGLSLELQVPYRLDFQLPSEKRRFPDESPSY